MTTSIVIVLILTAAFFTALSIVGLLEWYRLRRARKMWVAYLLSIPAWERRNDYEHLLAKALIYHKGRG